MVTGEMVPARDEGNAYDPVYSLRHAGKDTESSLAYTLGHAPSAVVRQTRTQDAGADEQCYYDFAGAGPAARTASERAPGPRAEEMPAAGAASSVLKGTGTWVFEKEWAIAPSAKAGAGAAAGGPARGGAAARPPSETHEKYKWPDMDGAGLGRARPAKQQQQLGENPLGNEKINYVRPRRPPARARARSARGAPP